MTPNRVSSEKLSRQNEKANPKTKQSLGKLSSKDEISEQNRSDGDISEAEKEFIKALRTAS